MRCSLPATSLVLALASTLSLACNRASHVAERTLPVTRPLQSTEARALPTTARPAAPAATALPASEALSSLPDVDLLHALPTLVAVSSAVGNDTDRPEALTDGRPSTAWNSRTGDVTTAWIEVHLPATAHVSAIRIIPGYARTTPREDLFVGNIRVARVRVLRDGVPLGEYPLDPTDRTMQSIPVSGPGGRYRIEVAAVVPGSHPRWREVCVSELEVLGTLPPGSSSHPTQPRFALGSADDAGVRALAIRNARIGLRAAIRRYENETAPAPADDPDPAAGCAGDLGRSQFESRIERANAAVELAALICHDTPALRAEITRYRAASARASAERDGLDELRESQPARATEHMSELLDALREDGEAADQGATAVLNHCGRTDRDLDSFSAAQ